MTSWLKKVIFTGKRLLSENRLTREVLEHFNHFIGSHFGDADHADNL